MGYRAKTAIFSRCALLARICYEVATCVRKFRAVRSGRNFRETEGASRATPKTKFGQIGFAGFPLGGAKGQTLAPSGGETGRRRWLKLIGRVAVDDPYDGLQPQVRGGKNAPWGIFSKFSQFLGVPKR